MTCARSDAMSAIKCFIAEICVDDNLPTQGRIVFIQVVWISMVELCSVLIEFQGGALVPDERRLHSYTRMYWFAICKHCLQQGLHNTI